MGDGFGRCWHKRLNALIFPEWSRDQQHQLHLELVRITSHVMPLQLLDQDQQLNERLTQGQTIIDCSAHQPWTRQVLLLLFGFLIPTFPSLVIEPPVFFGDCISPCKACDCGREDQLSGHSFSPWPGPGSRTDIWLSSVSENPTWKILGTVGV